MTQARNPYYANYRKIDDYTIEIGTPRPISYFPNMVTWTLIRQPDAVQEGRLMGGVRQGAGGHRPVQDHRVQAAGQRDAGAERRLLGQDPGRRSSTRSSLFPMPEATTRLSALRSGQVDWIEVPPPDAVPSLKSGRVPDRHQQLPACLAMDLQPGQGGLAVPRHPGAPRDQLLRQPRRPGDAAERSRRTGVRPVQEGRPVLRQPEAAIRLRPRQGEGAAEGGRLRPGQAGQGQDHDHDQRLGPDAAAADERVPAAEPEGVQFRHLVRGGRLGHDAGGAAQPADGAAGARRRCDEHQPAHLDGYLAIRACSTSRATRRQRAATGRTGRTRSSTR